MIKSAKKLITIFTSAFISLFALFILLLFLIWHFVLDLPDHEQLINYEPPMVTRVYASNGRLISEYAAEQRSFVPLKSVPKIVIDSFLSAEDKNFYNHIGIDFTSILRAAKRNINNLGSRPEGASTITQQVAKNFFLSREVSYKRKIKEILLALRIEQILEKDRILELYLNQIYLGFRSYGIAAASLNYFNKSLNELTIAEAAFLAALPKAPNNYHPIRKKKSAIARRNWVIKRLLQERIISEEQALKARNSDLLIIKRNELKPVEAQYFLEDVRKQLINKYGENKLYKGGLTVRTSLNPVLQKIADNTLKKGLLNYDIRHGWRGPLANVNINDTNLNSDIANIAIPEAFPNWKVGVVMHIDDLGANIFLNNDDYGRINLKDLKWARKWRRNQYLGPPVKHPRDVLDIGDIIYIEDKSEKEDSIEYGELSLYSLRQFPDVNGALIALDPHTGRIFAISGGISFNKSEFNRASQAFRQPGSAFKPFVYLTALEKGFAPNSKILDAPFVIDQGADLGKWSPENYTNKFYGLSTMRLGLEKSRNLMTIRLAQMIGIESIVGKAKKLNISDDLDPLLSIALGAGETTLERLTIAYAMLVNGGKKISPSLIDRVQNRNGETIEKQDDRICTNCKMDDINDSLEPKIIDSREQIINPVNAYQIVSMLEGAVLRGTGKKVSVIKKPLAGKTGTTNDSNDAWFIGFSPDLVVGVYVGFDTPKSLGPRETGASVASPIFRDFMYLALENEKGTPFRIPSKAQLVKVNLKTGNLAKKKDKNIILEAFTTNSEIKSYINEKSSDRLINSIEGLGGLY
ncbi:MAG: Penicillin-binding protein 1A [Alphaproteobacteria bacterium MarineAlpha6_Bin4]|nr:MAG: Penicillin-binding protein 1A [Alphaproteobacteria bacterium MarineAlpha6_Bin3]PPR37684.1 MAG: Penicillin-binding protein 1A [Alphaproteobacteria bacterium MarineAlpha6_Bin4]|tara:strand:- start:2615 stop:5032 length:2418 start_codon:yes stop_codon:yes gene_type:complete